jgi:flavin-dependent dehydrogenase
MFADAAERAGADVRRGTRVNAVSRIPGAFALRADRDVVTARVVVDATGRAARLARQLGARRVQLDQLACAGRTFELAPDDPAGDTLLEATSHGWWYVSPLPPAGTARRRMVACFADAATVAQLSLGTVPGWTGAAATTRHVASLIGGTPTGSVQVVTAASHQLDPCVGAGWLAVGDAALAVDPLSSGGVPFALRTAAAAADVLAGSAEAATYADLVAAEALDYRRTREEIYGWERRFGTDPFWQARLSLVDS